MAVNCSGFIEPLNLECIMINIFAGSALLFTFLSFIVIAILSARFRMNGSAMLLITLLFGLIFSSFMPGIYLIIILLTGLSFFFLIKRFTTIS